MHAITTITTYDRPLEERCQTPDCVEDAHMRILTTAGYQQHVSWHCQVHAGQVISEVGRIISEAVGV